MGIESFLKENVEIVEEAEAHISKRFKEPFRIKAISEKEDKALRDSCKEKIKMKYGQYRTETDHDAYLLRLVTACTVMPNFRSAELQKSWGVIGEEALIQKMLLPGEFTDLVNQIQALCGFDLEIDEAKEELKKPIEMAMENSDMPSTAYTNLE